MSAAYLKIHVPYLNLNHISYLPIFILISKTILMLTLLSKLLQNFGIDLHNSAISFKFRLQSSNLGRTCQNSCKNNHIKLPSKQNTNLKTKSITSVNAMITTQQNQRLVWMFVEWPKNHPCLTHIRLMLHQLQSGCYRDNI